MSIIEYSDYSREWAKFKEPEENLSFIVFLSLKTFLDLHRKKGIFSPKTEWLVNLPAEKIKDLYFSFSSQVYSLNQEGDIIVVKEHYNIGQEPSRKPQVIREMGYYLETKENDGWLSFTSAYIWERRKDLQGYEFFAETLDQTPFADYEVNENGTVDRIVGIVGDLWHGILEESLNFTTSISLPPDGNWGRLEEDGSWSGMVGGLLQNRTQIVVSSLYKSQSRLQAITFSEPWAKAFIRFFVKYPEREARWTTFLETFHFEVWLSLAMLVILLMVCLYISHVFRPEKEVDEESFTISNTSLVVCGTLIGQGSFIDPKTISARIIIMTGLFLGIITLFSFSGSLSSRLAIFHVTYPFKTLDGVLDSGFTIGGKRSAAELNSFFNAPAGSLRKMIAENLIEPHPPDNLGFLNAIKKMLAGNYALMSNSADVVYVVEDACALLEIPYDIETYDIGFGFANYSPYIDIFNYFIKKNIENGNIDRIKIKWTKSNSGGCLSQKSLDSMGFDNVVSAFFIITFGVAITVVFFCAELYLGGKKKVKQTSINYSTDTSTQKKVCINCNKQMN